MVVWTKMHLFTIIPSFIVFMGIAVGLSRVLKNESEFLKWLPIKIIAIILMFTEIVKQVESVKQGYNYYHLPFHFCSLFVFLFPLFAFYRGRYKDQIRLVTTIACSMLFLFMLVVPSTIYSESDITGFFKDYFSFHSVLFHNLVILGFFYILAVQDHKFNTKKDCKVFMIVFSLYCSIGCIMSQVLRVNFNSFYTCQIPIFEKARLFAIEKIDWVGQLIYIICLWIVILQYALMCYWLYRGCVKLYKHIKNKAINNMNKKQTN